MKSQAPTSICQLSLEQLAQVLQHVDLKARLGCCALVCGMWHAAAVAATRSISTSAYASFRSDAQSASVKFLQMHAWLLKHGQEAALGSLSVTGWVIRERLQLQLPVLQLAALTRLQLGYLSVDFQKGTSSQQSSSAALPQEWTSLTHLGLCHCPLELGALAAFTQLQHLSLKGGQQETELAGVAAVASAVPSMQHLSHLELGGSFAQDSLLTGVQHLPNLQVLLLQYGECTSRGLAEMPPTLTILKLDMRVCYPAAADVTLSHSSTPGLTKLTALQRLEVNGATAVHPALLGCLHSLQHLSVTGGLLDAAAGEPGLAALSTLTALQHLSLCSDDWGDIAATSADCAALTASSQLTFLSICADSAAPPGGLVADQQYIHMFPQGCRLPHLQVLRATMGLLGSPAAVRALVEGCPGLVALDLSTAAEGTAAEGTAAEGDPDEEADGTWVGCRHTMGLLSGLCKLTELSLNLLADQAWDDVGWEGLAQLTGLVNLQLGEVDRQDLLGIIALTSCKQLSWLSAGDLEIETMWHWPYDASSSDVWCRLPGEVLKLVLKKPKDPWSDDDDVEQEEEEEEEEDAQLKLQSALRLATVATAHLQCVSEQQRQECVAEWCSERTQQHELLQQALDAVKDAVRLQQQAQEQQLQQQEQRHQQELADMRASMAAMAAQLQAMQQQQQTQ